MFTFSTMIKSPTIISELAIYFTPTKLENKGHLSRLLTNQKVPDTISASIKEFTLLSTNKSLIIILPKFKYTHPDAVFLFTFHIKDGQGPMSLHSDWLRSQKKKSRGI